MVYHIGKNHRLVTYGAGLAIGLAVLKLILDIVGEQLSIDTLFMVGVAISSALVAYAVRKERVTIQKDGLTFEHANRREGTDIEFSDINAVRYNRISDNLEIATAKAGTVKVRLRTKTEAYRAIEKALMDNGTAIN